MTLRQRFSTPVRQLALAAGAFAVGLGAYVGAGIGHDELNGRPHHIDAPMNETAVMRAFRLSKGGESDAVAVNEAELATACVGGFAGAYPCDGVDLNAFVPRNAIGGDLSNDELNDIWGWTDPDTGREYALVGRVFGTSFVDVTDPNNPVYVGELPPHTNFGSNWGDVKVYANHAFIVSEARGEGMQVFDLTRLRTATPGTTFTEDAHYGGWGNAHNLVINEESGYAYGVGTNTCSGGLAMVDISDPLNPVGAGCFSADGYTHDAQCVNYRGPDPDWQGAEICFAANEDSLTIVDVTDKSAPVQIAKAGYPNSEYTHQGWLNEDHTLYFFNDELDESRGSVASTTTRTWDVTDLDTFGSSPPATFAHGTTSIDHNLYVEGRFIYQANYRTGLRILELADGGMGDPLGTIAGTAAYFDVYPGADGNAFNGAWSVYPYFASGTVVVSHIEQGLFVLTPNIDRVAFADIDHGDVLSGVVPINIAGSNTGGDAIMSLSFEVDGAFAGIDGGSWDTDAVADGLYRLTAVMEDTAGNVTSSTILVTVDNGAPNVAPDVDITEPGDGAEISGNVTLSALATDSDGTVVAVDFYASGALIGSGSPNGDTWSMNWNTKKVDKIGYTLTAVAFDDEGDSTTSAPVAITVISGKGGGGGDGGGGGNCPPKKPGCS